MIASTAAALYVLSASPFAQQPPTPAPPAGGAAQEAAIEERARQEERATEERDAAEERRVAEERRAAESRTAAEEERVEERLRSSQRALEERERELVRARAELEEAARDVARLSVVPGTVSAVRVGGDARRAALGITLVDAERGALVTSVTPNGPAAQAGVQTGDIVVAVDETPLADGEGSPSRQLEAHMRAVEPGRTVTLEVTRDGQARSIEITARENDPFVFAFGQPFGARGHEVLTVPGTRAGGRDFFRLVTPFTAPWRDMELLPLTEQLGRYFGTAEGLLVVRAPESDAIGLEDGDVILTIGGRTPSSPEHAMRILASFETGETLELAIMREQGRRTLEYTIPAGG
jgi:S1-C subfamily serine protease